MSRPSQLDLAVGDGAMGVADELDVQPRRQPVIRSTPPRDTAEEAAELTYVPGAGAAGGMPGAAWAITHELLPAFDGLLPARLVHDYVAQAVSDLAGSISVEALPEMAIRLASVRLHTLLGPDQPPHQVEVSTNRYPPGASDPAGAARVVDDTGDGVTPYPPVAVTATTTQQAPPDTLNTSQRLSLLTCRQGGVNCSGPAAVGSTDESESVPGPVSAHWRGLARGESIQTQVP